MSITNDNADTVTTVLVNQIVYRLARDSAEYIATRWPYDVEEVEALLQVGLGLAFHPFEVAAATDEAVCAHLTALLRFVFNNQEAAFYRSPESKEQTMPDNSDRPPGPRNIFESMWDPDEFGPGRGEFRAADPNRVRPVFKSKPANPFPEPDWHGVDRDRRVPVDVPVPADENG